MAGTQVTLTLGGDATQLQRAAAQAQQATQGVADSVTETGRTMTAASDDAVDYGSKMGHLGNAVSGATDALDSVGSSLTAVNDIMSISATRAARQARLLADVEQATIDLQYADRDLEDAILGVNQATLDGRTAQTDEARARNDAARATLDIAAATTELNKAIKEHGRGSTEAKTAQLDLTDAQLDLQEANIAVSQAQEDANVAVADGKRFSVDAKQAVRDHKDAQLDLNDAMKEAHPPELQKWADNLQLITPLLSAVVGIMGLVTAAQWLWNASLWASPVTWIVVAIAAVVAGIIILAMHTKELGEIWDVVWGGISDAASWAWDKIKKGAQIAWDFVKTIFQGYLDLPGKIRDAFVAVGGYILAPFRSAFNSVSDAWNHTIGQLHWSVPGWVPGIGGNSIGAPKLPKFHQGGTAPGSMGSEFLAILQAGETVSRGGEGHSEITVVVELVGDGVLKVVRTEVGRRGGDVDRALGGKRG